MVPQGSVSGPWTVFEKSVAKCVPGVDEDAGIGHGTIQLPSRRCCGGAGGLPLSERCRSGEVCREVHRTRLQQNGGLKGHRWERSRQMRGATWALEEDFVIEAEALWVEDFGAVTGAFCFNWRRVCHPRGLVLPDQSLKLKTLVFAISKNLPRASRGKTLRILAHIF